MKRNLLLLYWSVLLISTLAIGGVAFFLLQRENNRLHELAEESAKRNGQTIADNLDLLADGAKTSLAEALASFPDSGENALERKLIEWKASVPYIHSVFLYRPNNSGLVLPRAHTRERDELEPLLHTSSEGWIWTTDALALQQQRMQQMLALGSQNIANLMKNSTSRGASEVASSNTTTMANNYIQSKVAQAEVRNIANQASHTTNTPQETNNINANPFAAAPVLGLNSTVSGGFATVQQFTSTGGNISETFTMTNLTAVVTNGVFTISQGNVVWQSILPSQPVQNWVQIGQPPDSRWMCWIRPSPDGPVRGVVLSWSELEKKMPSEFPKQLNAGEGFVLRNPAGQAVVAHFASGRLLVGDSSSKPVDDVKAVPAFDPLAVIPVGVDMPGWTLSVYFNPAVNFSSSFTLVSTVLVGILLVSVLMGGTLLLREARREASDAARKTSFVSNVSHELKTPLTTIRMYAELLGEGRVKDPAKQRNYVNTIINESQRLTRLVNNVLDFSRLERGQKQYNKDDLAVGPVISDVLETQRPRLEESGFICEADLPANGAVRVQADRDALEQVMLNLVDNALKYAADGRWLGVRVTKDENKAILTVSDRGPGVPLAERERIFDMFHRVDDSITARQPGSGLGLSIARRLLRDQGGDLRYEPSPQGGSSFVATLPLVRTPDQPAAEQRN